MTDLIVSESTNTSYNLALDEVLLHSVSRGVRRGVVRVWIDDASIVIGAGLGVCEEVYCSEASRVGVPIYRRLSGGGAVYHDRGNINVSIILGVEGARVDYVYRLGTSFMSRVVKLVGLSPRVENMSDVVVNGFKVSGSSAYIKPSAFLFHATLLVNSDIGMLRRLIKPRLDRVVRGEVTPAKYNPGNLSWFTDIDTLDAIRAVVSTAQSLFKAKPGRLKVWEEEEAIILSRSKYVDLKPVEEGYSS